MAATGYVTLTRLSGLLREMDVVANNIANASTSGYRQQGILFSEFVARAGDGPSLSMADGNITQVSRLQGALTRTGSDLDMAIEGDGFFSVAAPGGERLTRAGNFTRSAQGDLVTQTGYPVLDAGGAPIFVPPDAGAIGVAPDGTLSADGRPLGQIAVVRPLDPVGLTREGGLLFDAPGGVEPVEQPRVVQGFLEGSNVDPVGQVARMIEVQRAYEMGQSFLDAENQRVKSALDTMTR